MTLNFLIVDTMHDSLLPLLDELQIKYTYAPDIQREEIKEMISGYEGLIVRSKIRVDHDLLENATKIEVVCRAGAGIDNLDIKAIEEKKIQVINAPEGNRDAVAEHCMGMLLAILARIGLADKQIRNKIWDREGNRGIELKGKSVGIIGYGNMGSAFAERLRSFGCKVYAYDKYKAGFGDDQVQEVDLNEIFQKADILSLHIPLTEETKGWVNSAFLSKFRKSIYLINSSRGEIIPLKDLVEEMRSGRISGAGLDVLENEKLETLSPEQKEYFEYLINSENVILTPHVAGWTNESYKRINEVLAEKLKVWQQQRA